jgi:type I restriction enzyme M protein
MSEDQKRVLEQQLWNIANTLRGKMNADEFRDYILGFIFYKYLSEKMEIFANEILKQDKIKFREINPKMPNSKEYLEAIKEEALEKLGYFLKPEELFTEVAKHGNGDNTEEDLNLSTMGTDSEEDFDNLFEERWMKQQKQLTTQLLNIANNSISQHLFKYHLSDVRKMLVMSIFLTFNL